MPKRKKQSIPKLTIFSRFGYILTRFDFLKILIKEKKETKTWKFWFFWNTVFAFVLTIFLFCSFCSWEKTTFPKLPDFKFSVVNGELSTNIKEPLFLEDSVESILLVLDTAGKTFGVDILDKQEKTIFIDKDKILIKTGQGNQKKVLKFSFNSLEKDFLIEKSTWSLIKNKAYFYFISFSFLFFWIYFSLFRLLISFFWTCLFWVIGSFLKIKNLTFKKTYFAVLNFSIMALLGNLIYASFLGINYFLTFLILSILFGLNFFNFLKKEDN